MRSATSVHLHYSSDRCDVLTRFTIRPRSAQKLCRTLGNAVWHESLYTRILSTDKRIRLSCEIKYLLNVWWLFYDGFLLVNSLELFIISFIAIIFEIQERYRCIIDQESIYLIVTFKVHGGRAFLMAVWLATIV